MDAAEKSRIAKEYYLQGYNCAQAVFTAFHEEMGMDEDFALRLSSSFGGGMGGLRGACGALTATFMVLGALQGYDLPDDMAAKQQHYQRVQQLAARFSAEFGTTVCRDLLLKSGIQPSSVPAERTPEYYRSRPCYRFIEFCAAMLADELSNG